MVLPRSGAPRGLRKRFEGAVLEHGEACALFDRYGDVQPVGRDEQGIYVDGTRHLSRLELLIGGERPLLLSETVTEDNAQAAVDLTNPRLCRGAESQLDQDLVHVFPTAVVWDGAYYQGVRLHSYALEPTDLELSLGFAADFPTASKCAGSSGPVAGGSFPRR